MTVATLENCDCAQGIETCGDVCACCDSPYAVGTCACDCVARSLAAVFDVTLADPAAFDAFENIEQNPADLELCMPFEPPMPTPMAASWEARYAIWLDAYILNGPPQIVPPVFTATNTTVPVTNFWLSMAPPSQWRIIDAVGGPS